MKQGKKLLALMMALLLTASMSVCALAEDAVIVQEEPVQEEPVQEEPAKEEPAAKLTVQCVDGEGSVLRDNEEDYLDLSKDLTVDDSYTRPQIENYSYVKMMLDKEELTKLTVTHDGEGKPVITAFFGEGEEQTEKTLTGSETLLFVYEKHAHSFDEGKVTTEPTCTEKGVKTFTCSCGETKTEEIPALGHDYDEGKATTEPTCTEKGVKTYTCKRDSSHTKTEEIPALGHEYDEGKVTKEATCTEDGVKTFTCKHDSSHTKTEAVPKLGHEYAHGRCTRCGAADPNFKPKLTDGTNGHANWGSTYIFRSNAAYKDFQKVLVDGKEVSSDNYKLWEDKGDTGVTLSAEFVKTLKAGDHEVSIVSATGTATKTVKVSDKPKTGDTDMGLWIGLLSFSALGCAAAAVTLKKKFSAR